MLASWLALTLAIGAGADMRWFSLDCGAEENALRPVLAEEVARISAEQGWGVSLVDHEESARELSYAGEDRGLLCHLLGIRPGTGKTWAFSAELHYRVSGLGAQVLGDKALCRAILAPLPGKSWLLGLAPAASLDESALRKTLQSPVSRRNLASRLQNLLRDGHAARNAGQSKMPRPGYPPLNRFSELEIGDSESEEAFAWSLAGKATRKIDRRLDTASAAMLVDDGVEVLEGGAMRFELDLRPLISDDLLLFGRSAGTGQGQIFVDGVPLAVWAPRSAGPSESGPAWQEAVVRIPNRLLAGKEKTVFEIRPEKGNVLSLFRLRFLRLPPPHGEYVSQWKARSGDPSKNQSVRGAPLVSGGYRFFWGVGVKAPSEIAYALDGSKSEFEVFAGIDDGSPGEGPVLFRLLVDGEERAKSRKLKKGDPPMTLRTSLEGAKELRLVAELLDPSQAETHVDWLEARAW